MKLLANRREVHCVPMLLLFSLHRGLRYLDGIVMDV